jgi:hemolysin activation/secretion protein
LSIYQLNLIDNEFYLRGQKFNKMTNKKSAQFIASLLFVSPAVFSATPDAGTVFKELNDANQSITNLPEAKRDLEPARPARVIVPLGTAEDLMVNVKSIQLLGDLPDDVPVEAISQILMEPKAITKMSELKSLASSIEKYVHDAGYPLFHVSVPEQEIFNGRVRMLVYNGKIDKVVTVSGDAMRIKEEVLQAYFTDLITTGGFKRLDFERTMLLVNDLPGVKAKLVLEPGREAGLISANLNVTEGPKMRGSVNFDNFGGFQTGHNRGTLMVKFDDLTNVGDRLTLMANATSSNLYAGLVEYKRPLGVSGLIGSVNAMFSDFQINESGNSLGVKGRSQSYEAGLSYPIVLVFGKNLYVEGSAASRNFSTEISGTDPQKKNIQAEKFGFRGSISDTLLMGGTNFGNLYFYNGVVNPKQGYVDTTSQSYQKMTFGLSRSQNLPNGFALQANLTGQRTHSLSMDSSEKFSLGGSSAVRAYGPSSMFVDGGNLFTAELAKGLGTLGQYGAIKSSIFYDQGTSVSDATYGKNKLRGAGVSLALQQWGSYEFKMIYSRRIGTSEQANLPDDLTNSGRVWLSFITFF